jgi:hypothetical protein
MHISTKAFSKSKIIVALLLFLLANLLMHFSPFGSIALAQITGTQSLPDTLFFYSPNDLFNLLTIYGVQGRIMYLNFQLIDYFYPLVYGYLLMAFLFHNLIYSRFHNWLLIPILPVLFDYFENILIRIQISSFPNPNNELALLSSSFTTLKWLFISLIILVTVYLYIRKKLKQE